MKKQGMIAWITLLLLTGNVYAGNVADIIAQNLKGTKILAVSSEPLPNDNAQVIIVKTTAGERRFIVTKANMGIALEALKNPALAGVNPVTINNQVMRIAMTGPVVLNPQNTHFVPNQPAATVAPQHAPGIVASVVTSANQQASR